MKRYAQPVKQSSHSAASVPDHRGMKVVKTVTINRPVEELYRFWRDLTNLPKFMKHLKEVTVLDRRTSHWEVKGPAGMVAKWEAEIINDHENELIAWRSRDGSEIANAGSVRFKRSPSGRGTEVAVALEYVPPGGKMGRLIAKWIGGEPEQQISEDLRRFKWIMETGEIPTTEGQPVGGKL